MSVFHRPIDDCPDRLKKLIWQISEATMQKYGSSSSTVFTFLSVVKLENEKVLVDEDHYLDDSDLLTPIGKLINTELGDFIAELMSRTRKTRDYWDEKKLLKLIHEGIILPKKVSKAPDWMESGDVFTMEQAIRMKSWGV